MLEQITPEVACGFTTVNGGVSEGVYASANLGFHVGDSESHVASNRQILERVLGVPVVWMDQVHGVEIVNVKSEVMRRDEHGSLSVGTADGMILDYSNAPETGLALAVMVADCVPILIVDRVQNHAGVFHMGRAGMEQGMMRHAIARFLELGSHPENLHVLMGPHICGKCYEVSLGVYEASPMEARCVTRWGTRGIDVVAGGRVQATAYNVEVCVSSECTYEHDLFYSHRRATHEGVTTGRFAGIACIKPSNTPVKY